jgi:predicted homoserine dehydrogenase-like protein
MYVIDKVTKVGIVGSGFIASGLAHLINTTKDFQISRVLTRRPKELVKDFAIETLTHSLSELIDTSDIVFECSGDVIHATEVVLAATNANKKVVTLNAEFHVTTGSYFVKKGAYVTDADGDQPGCLARLKAEIEGMGFEPSAYVNIKGYINLNPERKEMEYWSDQQGIRLEQVVSFTDGTKLQIEQAFVANGLGATIPPNGMFGKRVETINDLDYLIHASEQASLPISDFILCKGAPPGVLIVAKNKEADRLGNYIVGPLRTKEKLGYILLRPYHLCHLEALNTLRRVVMGEPILINNSPNPHLTVAAIAKREITAGDVIARGAGGFDVRGVAVRLQENKNAVPICLLQNTKLVRNVEPGQTIQFDDVELADTKALEIYHSILQ